MRSFSRPLHHRPIKEARGCPCDIQTQSYVSVESANVQRSCNSTFGLCGRSVVPGDLNVEGVGRGGVGCGCMLQNQTNFFFARLFSEPDEDFSKAD